MRSSGTTKFFLDWSVVVRVKSRTACFAGPSFHEASGLTGVWACPRVLRIEAAAAVAAVPTSIDRRLIPPVCGDLMFATFRAPYQCRPFKRTLQILDPSRMRETIACAFATLDAPAATAGYIANN